MATEKPAPEAPEPPDGDGAPGWSTRRKVIAAAVATALIAAVIAAVAILGEPIVSDPARPGADSRPDATTVPTPDPTSTAPVTPVDPAQPVPIVQPADISAGLTAAITGLESVEGEARGPGEVGGPAVRVTVTITNTTGADVSLATTVVTAYYGPQQTPALELGEPGSSPMPGTVAAGKTATGVYVFTVPPEQRGQLRVMVDYSLQVAPLVFEGPAPA